MSTVEMSFSWTVPQWANVMPVMQRFETGIAAVPDQTCTLILSMFGTSVAVMAVPGDAGV